MRVLFYRIAHFLQPLKQFLLLIILISISHYNVIGQDSVYMAPAKKKGLWGYIDKTGTWVIEPQYLSAKRFESNLGEVVYYDEEEDNYKTKFIDKNNHTIFQLPERNYSAFSEGFLAYKEGNLFGFIDSTGEKVIPAQFYHCSAFRNQKAVVEFRSGKSGYINHAKQLFISPRYDTAFDFHGNFAVVGKKDRISGVMKYGVIDQYGNLLIPFVYDWISNFGESKAFANTGGEIDNHLIRKGKWFILDLEREKTIPLNDSTLIVEIDNTKELPWLRFEDEASWFPGWKNGKIMMGLINNEGKWIKTPQYQVVNFISEGMAGVFNHKMGFIDKTGEVKVPFQFEVVGNFKNGLAKAKSGTLFGYINKNGEFVIEPLFEDAGDFILIR